MPKSPRRPGKPPRAAKPGPKLDAKPGSTQTNPWSHLIAATEATLITEDLERGGTEPRDTDTELLAECAIVDRVNFRPVTITEAELERAILRASVRRPHTLAGWRAKVDMALMLIETGREDDATSDDVDRMVPWLVLHDVLAFIDSLEALMSKTGR